MKKIIIPPVFVFLSLVSIVGLYYKLSEFNIIPFPYNLSGIAISFFGFIMMGQSRQLFKKYNTTLDFVHSTSLVTEGIYLKTRNPMYIGMFLLLSGIAVCFRNILSCSIPFIFILLIHLIFIPREENLMSDAFGQQYADYKNKVRRWL